MSRHLDTSTDAQINDPNHGPLWKTQSFFSKGICTVTLWQDLLWRRQFEKVLLEHACEKDSSWAINLSTEQEDYTYQCVDDVKMAVKTEDIEPTSKLPHERREFWRTNILLWPCLFGKISNDIVATIRDMFESTISAGTKEELLTIASGKLDADTKSSWSYEMEGHAKEMFGNILRICE